MDLKSVTFEGPEIGDEEILTVLPSNLAALLKQMNGFIQYHGGLHVFGACKSPLWHSIRELWQGESAAHRHYEGISPSDIPFAEDCLGFQFLLRDGEVVSLDGETGDVEELHLGLGGFFQWVSENPTDHLGMQPLLQFMQGGDLCQPGELLSEYPFFCTKEAENGVHLSKVSALERRAFLADIYKQLNGLEEGGKFDVNVR